MMLAIKIGTCIGIFFTFYCSFLNYHLLHIIWYTCALFPIWSILVLVRKWISEWTFMFALQRRITIILLIPSFLFATIANEYCSTKVFVLGTTIPTVFPLLSIKLGVGIKYIFLVKSAFDEASIPLTFFVESSTELSFPPLGEDDLFFVYHFCLLTVKQQQR